MMTPRYHTAHRAFTLIEVMVYLGLTILISYAGVLTFLSLRSELVRNATERTVNSSAEVALERLGRDIRDATTVDVPKSTLNASSSVLALTAGTTTTRFSVVGGQLMLEQNGITVGALTAPQVTVREFRVNRFVGSTTELVRVALTVSGVSNAASTTRTYYTSSVLRGSYE